MITKILPDPVRTEHYGLVAINPYADHNSASRLIMNVKQLAQKQTLINPEPQICQSGINDQIAEYNISRTVPNDVKILDIIHHDVTDKRSELTVLTEDLKTGEVGVIAGLKHFNSMHPRMGFRFIKGKDYDKLQINNTLLKGDVLLDSPASKEGRNAYNFGINLKTCLLTHPCVAEDGVGISKSAIKKFGYRTYDKLVINIDPDEIALNRYGNDKAYISVPTVGTEVPADGIIMAVRSIDPTYSAINMSVDDLREINHLSDTLYYNASPYKGVIAEVNVISGNFKNRVSSPADIQLEQLASVKIDYYKRMVSSYKRIKRRKAGTGDFIVSPELTKLMADYIILSEKRHTVRISHKRDPLPQYRVEIVIEREVYPNNAGKITDLFSAKSVIVRALDDDMMPMDKNGVRAELVSAPEAPFSRMIMGKGIEGIIAQSSCETGVYLQKHIALNSNGNRGQLRELTDLLKNNKLNKPLAYLKGYYKIINPDTLEFFNAASTTAQAVHILDILKRGYCIVLHNPNTKQRYPMDEMIEKLQASPYAPCYDRVSFKDDSGVLIEPYDKIRISPNYFIILEKDGSEMSATSTAKFSSMQIVSSNSKADKQIQPINTKNPALFGIDEAMIASSATSDEAIAETMDRSTNPDTMATIISGLLDANEPNNVTNLVNRKKIPYGGAKPLQLFKNAINSAGIDVKDIRVKK